jgi:calcineurin-like phosphoesterase family protein
MQPPRKYFFSSDQHFSHSNIIRYSKRPFKNADEMNETIIERWNATVSPQDIIYTLGDVMFEKDKGKMEWLLSRLNGEKHLIWGNHDKGLHSIKWQRYFNSAAEMKDLYIPPESNGGTGQHIVLCHYPLLTWNKSHHGSWALHGHCHGSLPEDIHARRVDVGVDCWDFTPVSMEQLTEKMSKKIFKPVDQHRGERKGD